MRVIAESPLHDAALAAAAAMPLARSMTLQVVLLVVVMVMTGGAALCAARRAHVMQRDRVRLVVKGAIHRNIERLFEHVANARGRVLVVGRAIPHCE